MTLIPEGRMRASCHEKTNILTFTVNICNNAGNTVSKNNMTSSEQSHNTMKKIIPLIALALTLALSQQLMAAAGYYEQGRKFYTRKQYEKAKEMFLKATESGNSGNAYYFLGEIEKTQGNYLEAEKYYKTAITKTGISRQYMLNSYWNAMLMAEQRNDYESVVSICRSMWIKNRDASARQKIESLINKMLWTDNTEAMDKYNDGIGLKRSGKTDEAIARFNSALGIDSSFLAPKFELGMAAYNSGDLDRASSYLGEVASKIPFYAEVQHVLADIQFRRHNYRIAIDHYNRVLEYGFIDGATNNRIRIRRGTCYYKLSDYTNAEEDIEKAIRNNARSTDVLLLLSVIKIKMGKDNEAMKTLQQANAASPDNPEIHYQIGSIHYRENDARYVAAYDRLFALAGGKKTYPARYRKAFIKLAKHHYENKNFGRTITILKTFDEKSQSFETRLLTAKSHYGLKEYDNAIDQFEKLSLGNDDKYTLCKAYAQTGRRQKAKGLLSELSLSSDYLSRAKRDPLLSGMAREMESGSGEKKPEPEMKKPEEKKEAEPKKKINTSNDDSDDEDDEDDDEDEDS